MTLREIELRKSMKAQHKALSSPRKQSCWAPFERFSTSVTRDMKYKPYYTYIHMGMTKMKRSDNAQC